jgi:protein arginine kinase activator
VHDVGLCERCKKAQATFHLTSIQPDGQKLERHLCDHCATEEGHLQIQKPTVNVNDLLEGFVGVAKDRGGPKSDAVCDECGLSYVEFRNQGLLGCAHDYDAFGKALAQLIERAQDGGAHHVGKTPRDLGTPRVTQVDMRRLRRQLQEALAAEDYERAADLRDRIRALEGA